MRIHCDVCGAEIEKEEALEVEGEEGEIFFFCSEDCAAQEGYHQTYSDPGREEDASAADDR